MKFMRRATARILLMAVVLMLCTVAGQAQQVVTLNDAMRRGDVSLHSVTGSGSSTGHVVYGYLTNHTSSPLSISVSLATPLYLVNSGAGQDMVATEVYERGGSYWEVSGQYVIKVPPGPRAGIVFKAYCVDFEKPNPTWSERFALRPLPNRIASIVRQMAAQDRLSQVSSKDNYKALQIALWLAQGVSPEDINQRFSAARTDWQTARSVLRRAHGN